MFEAEAGPRMANITLVDDDENIVQLVKMYLERDGYQVWRRW